MMSPHNLKFQMLNEMAQIVIFDAEGVIKDSCHSLADLHGYIGQSVFDLFPLLLSMKETLSSLEQAGEAVVLPGVEMDALGLNGIFDLELKVHPKQANHFVWLIVDQSRLYEYFRSIQQERNELRMNMEYLLQGKLKHMKK